MQPSDESTASLWVKKLAVLRGHTDIVNETAFSPDGRWVVTASDHQRARVFRSELCGSVDELLELAKRRLGN
jgi:WD40 repeat protein